MLDEQVLEASVAKALEQVRNEQNKFPDQRVAIEREFFLIQTRPHHLVEHIANGRATDAIDVSLRHEEARKKTLLTELVKLDELVEMVQVDENRLAKELRNRVGDIPTLFARQIPLARQMLRKLLDGHIVCEPVEKGGKPSVTLKTSGNPDLYEDDLDDDFKWYPYLFLNRSKPETHLSALNRISKKDLAKNAPPELAALIKYVE